MTLEVRSLLSTYNQIEGNINFREVTEHDEKNSSTTTIIKSFKKKNKIKEKFDSMPKKVNENEIKLSSKKNIDTSELKTVEMAKKSAKVHKDTKKNVSNELISTKKTSKILSLNSSSISQSDSKASITNGDKHIKKNIVF